MLWLILFWSSRFGMTHFLFLPMYNSNLIHLGPIIHSNNSPRQIALTGFKGINVDAQGAKESIVGVLPF